MKRFVYKKLVEWKNNPSRKPLIVDGARQVGKTWILREFGQNEFRNTVYINCDKVVGIKESFFDFDVNRLLRVFSSLTEEKIVPGETLIILDEIQEVPLGLTALKYFCEDAPQYHIVVAGSLLGISLHGGTGFPVGKVNCIKMYPMTFSEFLDAAGRKQLLEMIQSHKWDDLSPFSSLLTDLLRQYYFVGGMPEAVEAYFSKGDLSEVRDIQNRILDDYEKDFSKHIPTSLLSKVRMVWNSIPSQLAKENKKFIYGALKKGARAKEFENALEWLSDAGLIHRVIRVRKIERPLKFYEDFEAFKVFFCDLGLLGAKVDVKASQVMIGEGFFSEYKGAFTEQYVAQELIAGGENPYYHSKEDSSLEIDFVIQKENVYPVEVKAEENLKSKSLSSVLKSNESLSALRFSMSPYREQDRMVNVPLYLVHEYMTSIS